MFNDVNCDLKLLQPMEQPLGQEVLMSTEEYHQLQWRVSIRVKESELAVRAMSLHRKTKVMA